MAEVQLPLHVHTLEDLQALQHASTVLHTPCGEGGLVWHAWGSGRPVVLLHGGAGSWTHWARNIAPLVQAGHRVLAADMPGFGDSAEPPDGHDADVLPGWLEQGLHALIGDAPVDLVGFSFGGLVGGLWAAAHPARVRRLVLVGAPALSEAPMAPLPLRAWDTAPPGERRDALHRHNLGVLMLSRPEAIDALAVALHGANIERDRMRRRRLMRTDLLRRTLPQLRCPVHGLWGDDDVLYRGRLQVVRDALAQAPAGGSLRFIAGAGHWVPYEAAEEFNAALVALLDEARP